MAEDLTPYNAPAARLFPAPPPSPAECDEYRLTDEQAALD